MLRIIFFTVLFGILGSSCHQAKTSRKRADSDAALRSSTSTDSNVSSHTSVTTVTNMGTLTKTSTGSSTDGGAKDLDGAWTTSCYKLASWFIDSIIFKSTTNSKGTFTLTHTAFTDAACTISNLFSIVNVYGDYVVGQTLSSPSGAKQLDIPASKVTFIPMNEQLVGTLSSKVGSCGSINWQLGQPADITGKTGCFYENSSYTIFLINGNNLQLGANAGAQPSTRATSLNPLTFIKK